MRSRGPSSIEGRRSMSLCVSESWDLIQRHERSVMVTGIVGSASVLLDDDPFRTPRLAANFGIHIVLAIVTARQNCTNPSTHDLGGSTGVRGASALAGC